MVLEWLKCCTNYVRGGIPEYETNAIKYGLRILAYVRCLFGNSEHAGLLQLWCSIGCLTEVLEQNWIEVCLLYREKNKEFCFEELWVLFSVITRGGCGMEVFDIGIIEEALLVMKGEKQSGSLILSGTEPALLARMQSHVSYFLKNIFVHAIEAATHQKETEANFRLPEDLTKKAFRKAKALGQESARKHREEAGAYDQRSHKQRKAIAEKYNQSIASLCEDEMVIRSQQGLDVDDDAKKAVDGAIKD